MKMKSKRLLSVFLISGLVFSQSIFAFAEESSDIENRTEQIEENKTEEITEPVTDAPENTTIPETENIPDNNDIDPLPITDKTITEPNVTEDIPVQNIPEEATFASADDEISSQAVLDPSTFPNRITGTWKKTNGKWWFDKGDGSYPANGIFTINNTQYAFDKWGYMVTGWYSKQGRYYYFDDYGAIVTGWKYTGGKWYYLNKAFGDMHVNGYYIIDNKGYCFDKYGAMITSAGWHSFTSKYDNSIYWTYLKSDGTGYDGWIKSGRSWYYFIKGYMAQNGTEKIGKITYLFNKSGAMVTTVGWYCDGYNWFYAKGDGSVYTGWLKQGNKWYYLQKDYGYMYHNGLYQIGNNWYAFDKSGTMITGWYHDYYKENEYEWDTWYYFDKNTGAKRTGWLKDAGNWYYLNEYMGSGDMCRDGMTKIGNKMYAFNKSGVMITGWYLFTYDWTDSGNTYTSSYWYYFDKTTGVQKTSCWIADGSKWYYLDEHGIMLSDCRYKISGKWYAFKKSGIMTTGWYREHWLDEYGNIEYGDYYYFDKNKGGAQKTGWIQDGGNWYYCVPEWDGSMIRNSTYEIDGKEYNFDEEGKCTNR